jgi:predicted SnoaL-like aldol condensation-catalyzing enzyme
VKEDDMRRRALIAGAALAGAAPFVARSATAPSASIVERFAQALTAHDLIAFATLFAENYVNHQFSAASPPPKGVTPKTATVGFFDARLAGLPDLKVTVEQSLAQDDLVAASFAYEGAHKGVLYGFEPTGKTLHFTSCDIFRVAEGKIVEHWGMSDIAGIIAQLKG